MELLYFSCIAVVCYAYLGLKTTFLSVFINYRPAVNLLANHLGNSEVRGGDI